MARHKLWFGVSVEAGHDALIADTLCGRPWNPKDGAPCRDCQRRARGQKIIRFDRDAVFTRTLVYPASLTVH